jgi:hypothetical protein
MKTMLLALNGAIMFFVIAWSVWLWAMFVFPQWWESVVERELALLTRLGILPPQWKSVFWFLETGWFSKSIIAVTIFVAVFAQHYC